MTLRSFVHAVVWVKRHLAGECVVPEMAAVAHFVGSGEVCFDIGAHAGAWSRPLSDLVGRNGHVYAFEALPYYAEVLRLTLDLLRIRNVTVINRAVADHDRRVPLIWRDESGKRLTGLTHIASSTENTKGSIAVRGIALDGFVASRSAGSRVTFVKADVEGAEMMVVQGARQMIHDHRPVFYLEIVTRYCSRFDYRPADLFRFFEVRDYRSYVIRDGSIWETDERAYAGRGDVLFVPSERLQLCRELES